MSFQCSVKMMHCVRALSRCALSRCTPRWFDWPMTMQCVQVCIVQVYTEMVWLTNDSAVCPGVHCPGVHRGGSTDQWQCSVSRCALSRCTPRWFDWPMTMRCVSTLTSTETCFCGSNTRHRRASLELRCSHVVFTLPVGMAEHVVFTLPAGMAEHVPRWMKWVFWTCVTHSVIFLQGTKV